MGRGTLRVPDGTDLAGTRSVPLQYQPTMRRFLYRLSLLLIVAWTLTLLPSPTRAVPLRLKNGLIGIMTVLYIGKMLYDTLFYDRYSP
jgi:hypothetical protein